MMSTQIFDEEKSRISRRIYKWSLFEC